MYNTMSHATAQLLSTMISQRPEKPSGSRTSSDCWKATAVSPSPTSNLCPGQALVAPAHQLRDQCTQTGEATWTSLFSELPHTASTVLEARGRHGGAGGGDWNARSRFFKALAAGVRLREASKSSVDDWMVESALEDAQPCRARQCDRTPAPRRDGQGEGEVRRGETHVGQVIRARGPQGRSNPLLQNQLRRRGRQQSWRL